MAVKTIPISEMTFVRSIMATKNGSKQTVIAQPYISGMYVSVNGQGIGVSHKKYTRWVKESVKRLEADGWEVSTIEAKYTDYIPEQDLVDYNVI